MSVTKCIAVIIGIFLCSLAPFHLATAEGDGVIAKGFKAAGSVSDGVLVSVEQNQQETVRAATLGSADRLAGVVVDEPLVALAEDENKVQVVIGGTAFVLVSDINGTPKAGDRVTASPIEGVGMKATTNTTVIGTAQASFDAIQTDERTIADRDGKPHTVRIGRLPVQIAVATYVAPASNLVPPFIQNWSNAIAGRPVSFIRIILAATTMLIAAVSIFILLYASTRAGIISIGRNPLAAGAIRKGLLQVGLYTAMILAFSLIAAYLMLTI
jgi:hypothetical protein